MNKVTAGRNKPPSLDDLLARDAKRLRTVLRRGKLLAVLREAGVTTTGEDIGRADLDRLAPALEKVLDDDDQWVRIHALEVLGAFGPTSASGRLAKTLLHDPSTSAQNWAAVALGKLMSCPRDVVPALMTTATSGDANNRGTALESLFRYDYSDQATELLRVAASAEPDPVGLVVIGGVAVLFAALGERAHPTLRLGLAHRMAGARAAATLALCYLRTRDPSFAPALDRLLTDLAPAVRASAALALATIELARVPDLIPHLKDIVEALPHALAKRSGELLCDVSGPGAAALPAILPAARQMFGRAEWAPFAHLGPDAVTAVREALASKKITPLEGTVWLTQLRTPDAWELVQRAYQREADRPTLARCAGYLGDRGVRWVDATVQDPTTSPAIAALMIESLRFAGPAALPVLGRTLEDPRANMRRHACDALAALGAREGIGLAATVLGDGDRPVRLAAALAMIKLGETERSIELILREFQQHPDETALFFTPIEYLADRRLPANATLAQAILPVLIPRLSDRKASWYATLVVGTLLPAATDALRREALAALDEVTGVWSHRRDAVEIILNATDPAKGRQVRNCPLWTRN